jgi:hypothetical protein
VEASFDFHSRCLVVVGSWQYVRHSIMSQTRISASNVA